MKNYVLVIESQQGQFWGYFPDVPGCTTAGDSLEQIAGNAEEALSLHLEEEEAPAARALHEVAADPEVLADLSGGEFFTVIQFDESKALAPA